MTPPPQDEFLDAAKRGRGADKARQMLKVAQLYCTEARIAILQVLMQAARPLRQDQIAGQLTERAMSKVTVYRTLESLIEVGLVHRAFTYQRAWYFELADHCTEHQCHPHFTCTNCGVTHCLMDVLLPLAKISQKGFVVDRQQVRLEGLCPACA
ncbi:MAG: transcriptional repressor [Planctomycetes bacterium]|jgi:Fur family ferric uptake transcriptional regulator|nr:transcriptional repressor [Planctomycetota bacterium]